MGGRRIRQRSWRCVRRCEALRQPCSLRHRPGGVGDATRRTCYSHDTSSIEQQQQLGRLVVAGWLRVCGAPRPAAVVGRVEERAIARRRARAWCGTETGKLVALRNSGLWICRGCRSERVASVCRRRASGQARQGWLRAVFQSVVAGESRQPGARARLWALVCAGAGGQVGVG